MAEISEATDEDKLQPPALSFARHGPRPRPRLLSVASLIKIIGL